MIPDPEADPWDDEAADLDHIGDDGGDDEVRSELATRIEDLEPDQQAQLVALMWVGRGDMEPEEWDEAVALAADRHEGATADYLLSHPHVADHLDEGLDRLFDGSDLMETGEYLARGWGDGARDRPDAAAPRGLAQG